MDKSIVGRNIKLARKKKKMKQKELAEMIGYTESSISKYEQGLVQIPNSVIELIAKALNVPITDILDLETWEDKYNTDGKLAQETSIIGQLDDVFGKGATELLQQFQELNDLGKKKMLEIVSDISLIPKYTDSVKRNY